MGVEMSLENEYKTLLVSLSLEEKAYLYKKALHQKDSMSLTLVKLLRADMESNKELV